MKKNMGGIDRITRIAVAAILGFLYYNGTISGTWGLVLMGISAIFVLTSLVSFCPIYTLLGVSTCKIDK